MAIQKKALLRVGSHCVMNLWILCLWICEDNFRVDYSLWTLVLLRNETRGKRVQERRRKAWNRGRQLLLWERTEFLKNRISVPELFEFFIRFVWLLERNGYNYNLQITLERVENVWLCVSVKSGKMDRKTGNWKLWKKIKLKN